MALVEFSHTVTEVIAAFDDPLFTRADIILVNEDTNRVQALVADGLLEIGYLPRDLTPHFCAATYITLKATHPEGHEVVLHAPIKNVH